MHILKIAKTNQILNKKTFKYFFIFLFLTVLITSGIKSASYADTPVGQAYCYLSQTGITYVCGPGPQKALIGGYSGTITSDQQWGNVCTTLPIQGTDGKIIPAGGCNSSGDSPLSQFSNGTCYIEGVNSSGNDVWIAQKDCTSANFSNIAPATTNMPTDITNWTQDTAVGSCGLNTNSGSGSGTCDLVQKYINPTIDFLAAAVGIICVISVVLGGIQYSASADNPQASAAAKKRIANAVLAAVVFLFLWGFLQFIVPGGLLNG